MSFVGDLMNGGQQQEQSPAPYVPTPTPAPSSDSTMLTEDIAKPDNSDKGDNLAAADKELKLNPQEKVLYERHLTNLNGPGGVDHPNGDRSTLYQAVQEHDGKFYNIPTVWNGKIETEKYTTPSGKEMDVPNKTALANVAKEGWDKFPAYASPDEADARYEEMHKFIDKDTAAYRAKKGRK